MYQATSTQAGPSNSSARCELTDTATITCTRSGTTGAVNVWWYTVARPTGLTVQHFRGIAATGATQNIAFTGAPYNGTAVTNTNDSFVLLSTNFTSGTYSGQMTRAQLTSTSNVQLDRQNTPTGTEYLQVVEWTGANVVRGTGNIASGQGASANVTVADSTTTPTFLLNSWRWHNNTVNDEACNQFIHGSISNSTTLVFSRGAGGTGACLNGQIDFAYERVSLPAGNIVDPFTVAPGVNTDGATQALGNGPFDLTRSLAFVSGQGFEGQSTGECNDVTNDLPLSCSMKVTYADANTLDYRRATGVGTHSSWFNIFAVQVNP
jgi:hypothetical protein